MWGNLKTRRRFESPCRRPGRPLSLERLEDRRVLAPVAFSFVDANNNQTYESGTDVALVAGEVDDGYFDTRRAEGGYTSVIAGAGLVINGPSIGSRFVTMKADADLVINTDLEATRNVLLVSRYGSVRFDDPTVQARKHIRVNAAQDITSTADSFLATGRTSMISLVAQRDIDMDFTFVEAPNGRSRITVQVGRDAHLEDCHLNAGGRVSLVASGDVSVVGCGLESGNRTDVRAHRALDATGCVINAGAGVSVIGRGQVITDHATIEARRDIYVASSRSDVSAVDAWFSAEGTRRADVTIKAWLDLQVSDATLRANRYVTLRARDAVMADGATLLGTTGRGRVGVYGGGEIDLSRATIRAHQTIKLQSFRGDADLSETSVAISHGSRRGDIWVSADDIHVGDAEIAAPDRIVLRGTQVGNPAFIGAATRDIAGPWDAPRATVFFCQVEGPYDFHTKSVGSKRLLVKDTWDSTAPPLTKAKQGSFIILTETITGPGNGFQEDGQTMRAEQDELKIEYGGKRVHRSVLVVPDNVASSVKFNGGVDRRNAKLYVRPDPGSNPQQQTVLQDANHPSVIYLSPFGEVAAEGTVYHRTHD